MPQCLAFGIDRVKAACDGDTHTLEIFARYDKLLLRKQIGLEPDLPVVLLMGGGWVWGLLTLC